MYYVVGILISKLKVCANPFKKNKKETCIKCNSTLKLKSFIVRWKYVLYHYIQTSIIMTYVNKYTVAAVFKAKFFGRIF